MSPSSATSTGAWSRSSAPISEPIASLRYTFEFVCASLRAGSSRLLEIGCGEGALARMLLDAPFEVVAVDSDAEAVAKAKAAGVDARLAPWPIALDGRFDAILFTRSLHHIEPLDESVEAAVAALAPGGRVIVEDFRAEGGSQRSERWFESQLRELAEEGVLVAGAAPDAILARSAPGVHEHGLHSSSRIAAALARHGPVEREGAAYYFRYAEPELAAPELSGLLLQRELAAISDGSIDALGQRFVLAPDLA